MASDRPKTVYNHETVSVSKLSVVHLKVSGGFLNVSL